MRDKKSFIIWTNGTLEEEVSLTDMKNCMVTRTLSNKGRQPTVSINKEKSRILVDISDAALNTITTFLRHYGGTKPPVILKPLRSTKLAELMHDKWATQFLTCLFEQKSVFYEVLHAAHAYGLPTLLDLCSATLGASIKGRTLKEIRQVLST